MQLTKQHYMTKQYIIFQLLLVIIIPDTTLTHSCEASKEMVYGVDMCKMEFYE